MRVLVTGAGGQLGGDLIEAVRRRGHDSVGVDHGECDITDAAAVARAIDAAGPEAVVNCAAWTDVDGAETNADAAAAVNGRGPGIVASACAHRGIRLLHVSTDYVFDGSASRPIAEDARPLPLSVYGRTKLDGEEAVRRALPDALVVRTAWLYGGTGPNFIVRVLEAARRRGDVRVVDDQHGSPTWTGHLAPALVHLLERRAHGLFHLASGGVATRYEQAIAALDDAGLGDVVITRVKTSEHPTPARRPAYSALECRAWRELGEPPLPGWREGVRAYVAGLRERGWLAS